MDDVVKTSSVDLSQDEENNIFPWLNVTNIEECNLANLQFKKYIDEVIIAPYGHIKSDQEFFRFADFYLFDKVVGNVNVCIALIAEGKKGLDYFWTVLDLITNVTQGNLNTMKDITSLREIFQFPKFVNDFDARIRQVCLWLEPVVDVVQKRSEYYREEYYREEIGEVQRSVREIEKTIKDFGMVLIEINYMHLTKDIEQYLAKNINKQELINQFLSLQKKCGTKRKIPPTHPIHRFSHTQL